MGQWDLDTMLTDMFPKHMADTTSTCCTESMWMPGFSCLTSGLFSYYNFDNWAYQPSYVSSNTPWFFNGLRVQIFPRSKLKIEPWYHQRMAIVRIDLTSGRASAGKSCGGRMDGSTLMFNNYGMGTDDAGRAGRSRHPHRRQHRGEVLRQARKCCRQDGVFADRRHRAASTAAE